MKNVFEKPELEIVLVGSADIITTSGTGVLGDEVWGPWIEV